MVKRRTSDRSRSRKGMHKVRIRWTTLVVTITVGFGLKTGFLVETRGEPLCGT